MTIVRKVDGAWQTFAGVPQTLARMASDRLVTYHDGRQETEACAPYPVDDLIDPGKVAQLVAEGTWGDADLVALGLKAVSAFVAPEGMRPVGEASYEEQPDGSIAEVCQVEDIPPPPPPPTTEQKIAAAGLSNEEIDDMVAKANQRLAAKARG